ncbi:MAG: hypothetical protein FWH53_09795 [Leptospirales bacterium]|nr:hypothetical protein [Leptospirales bacterium]
MIVKSDSFSKDFKEKVKLKVSDKFDLSIIGSIDLAEAEVIAKEEALFLTENDIMMSLENFELVPIKFFEEKKEPMPDDKIYNLEQPKDPEVSSMNEETVTKKSESSDDLELAGDISDIITFLDDDYIVETDRVNAVKKIKDEPNESKLIDITDSIIILEDKEKLIELTSEFPEKGDNLVKLLSYLDGLFEKLPEDVIRKFAESEYFDLYSKILKDMKL